jgi:4-alpha-glucanotransferase
MPWPLVEMAMSSKATLAVLPMQDILSLGSDNRMNKPGTTANNWQWRFSWAQVPVELAARIHVLVERYTRNNTWL